jgi:hypothetical protein
MRFLKRIRSALLINLSLASACMFASMTLVAQDFQEWSAETRTSLGFQVNAEAVRSLLPEGWTVSALTDAPTRVNLSLTFMDRHIVLNAQGQAVGTGTSRYMVVSVQARNIADGRSGVLIINGISPEGPGAYEVYQPAAVSSATRRLSGEAEENAHIEERWEMMAESGDRVTLALAYRQALPVRRQSTIVIRSGKHTEYTRTYRIDQASDVLGTPDDVDSRIESMEFTASGPLFSRLFDGNEVLTGVTSTPWYVREISVP